MIQEENKGYEGREGKKIGEKATEQRRRELITRKRRIRRCVKTKESKEIKELNGAIHSFLV